MSAESWKPVVGWEGLYEVSDMGRVRSFNRVGRSKADGTKSRLAVPRILKPTFAGNPYPVYNLRDRDQRLVRGVHVLVAAAFHGPRPEGLVIRHLNGDARDNRPENLAYGTAAENVRDTVRHGHHHLASRTHCANGHEFTAENTGSRPSQPGTRDCLTCRRIRNSRKAQAAA